MVFEHVGPPQENDINDYKGYISIHEGLIEFNVPLDCVFMEGFL